MKWKRVAGISTDILEVRLQNGKPEYFSSLGLSLEAAIQVVGAWVQTNEDSEIEAWLEAARDEADLASRTDSHLMILALLGADLVTREEARSKVIRDREFERGDQAFTAHAYAKALHHLKPLAESGHPDAQFRLGLMLAKGAGIPNDNIAARV
jgi:TPR repeat protein